VDLRPFQIGYDNQFYYRKWIPERQICAWFPFRLLRWEDGIPVCVIPFEKLSVRDRVGCAELGIEIRRMTSMLYGEVLTENQVFAALDKEINRFSAAVRLNMVRRVQRLQSCCQAFEKAREGIARDCGVLGKEKKDCTPEAWKQFEDGVNVLLNTESGIKEKKWKPEDLKLDVNQIPVGILAFLLEEEKTEAAEEAKES
jgi:hypothetical protein